MDHLIVRRLTWDAVSIPLRQPFETARGIVRRRESIILWLDAGEGILGVGEVSPPLGLGRRGLHAELSILQAISPTLVGLRPLDIAQAVDQFGETRVTRPVAAGIDIAIRHASAKVEGKPLSATLGEYQDRVPLNAAIAFRSPLHVEAAARRAAESGFSTLELKVGQAGTRDDLERVAAARLAAGPKVRIRLDANAAWDVFTAIQAIEQLSRYDIEYVEQPVAQVDDLKAVRRSVDVPIAADESVAGIPEARHVLEEEAADVLVIKPSVVGGLAAARSIATLATLHGTRTVLTSSIDSGIAIAAALHVAAAMEPPIPACGLATAHLLESSLLAEELQIHDGFMLVPVGPGLGIQVDRHAVDRYRVLAGGTS